VALPFSAIILPSIMTNPDADLLRQSVESDNVPAVGELLSRNPAWLDRLMANGCSGWVERGAELDPRDDDHNSTPAQWRIGDAPEVTRFLIARGACPDFFWQRH
jgi:hypothetical protein